MQSSEGKRPHIAILAEKMGQGHMSISQAIVAGLEKQYPGKYDIKITDISSLLGNSAIDHLLLSVHKHIAKHAPWLYKLLFQAGNLIWLIRLINRTANKQARTNVRKFFTDTSPIIVVSVFPTWNPLIARIYKELFPKQKFLVVVTDLIYAHGAWVSAPDADLIIAGNPETQAHLEAFNQSLPIKVLGLPAHPKLLEPVDEAAALQGQGLDPKAFTTLYLISPVETPESVQAVISKLEADFPDDNLIVATGRNEAMLSKLTRSRTNHTALLGWTENMTPFLHASKILITKAGGAIINEGMTLGRPLIVTYAVTGEEGNAETVVKYGYGLWLKPSNAETITAAVSSIKQDYAGYTKRLAEFPYRHATKNIAELINQTIQETT
jgi:processive 1,2-diacylglycerol beta-glucosyltransferase